MKYLIKQLIIAIIIFFIFLTICLEAISAEPEQPRLILLQSVIGEAGFKAHESGEDFALMHVYKKRELIIGKWSLYKVVRKYSSAVKKHKAKPNKWVNFINLECEEPVKFWSKKLKWQHYKKDCEAILKNVDLFLAGESIDPLPEAEHYGSPIDPKPIHFIKIKTKYRNVFYKTKGIK